METPLPDPIRNRVDESGLIALDLDQLAPKANVRSLDLSAYLEQGLILREKPFRTAMAELNAADWDGARWRCIVHRTPSSQTGRGCWPLPS